MFKSLIAFNNILLSENGKAIPRNNDFLNKSNHYVCFYNNGNSSFGFRLTVENPNKIPTGSIFRLKDSDDSIWFSGSTGADDEIRLNNLITPTSFYKHPTEEWELELVSAKGKILASQSIKLWLYYTPVLKESKLLYRKGVPVKTLDHINKISTYTNKSAINDGESEEVDAPMLTVPQVANNVFNDVPPRYDVWQGRSYYGNYSNKNNITFHLDSYQESEYPRLNCYDSAAAVQYYLGSNGYDSRYCYMNPFGYLMQTDLVGRGICNNPFYGDDDDNMVVNRYDDDRTAFGNHAFVRVSATYRIVDSCAGPHVGNETLATYIDNAVDDQYPDPPDVEPGTTGDVTTYVGVQHVDFMMPVGSDIYKDKMNDPAFNSENIHSPIVHSHRVQVKTADIISMIKKAGWKLTYSETVPGEFEGLQLCCFKKQDHFMQLKIFSSSQNNQYAINRFFDLALNIQSPDHQLSKVNGSIFHQHVENKNKGQQLNIIQYYNLAMQVITTDIGFDLTSLANSFATPINASLVEANNHQNEVNVKLSVNRTTKQYRLDLIGGSKTEVLEFIDVNDNLKVIDCSAKHVVFEKRSQKRADIKVWSINQSNLMISKSQLLAVS